MASSMGAGGGRRDHIHPERLADHGGQVDEVQVLVGQPGVAIGEEVLQRGAGGPGRGDLAEEQRVSARGLEGRADRRSRRCRRGARSVSARSSPVRGTTSQTGSRAASDSQLVSAASSSGAVSRAVTTTRRGAVPPVRARWSTAARVRELAQCRSSSTRRVGCRRARAAMKDARAACDVSRSPSGSIPLDGADGAEPSGHARQDPGQRADVAADVGAQLTFRGLLDRGGQRVRERLVGQLGAVRRRPQEHPAAAAVHVDGQLRDEPALADPRRAGDDGEPGLARRSTGPRHRAAGPAQAAGRCTRSAGRCAAASAAARRYRTRRAALARLGQLAPVGGTQLPEQRRHVGLHGPFRHREARRDLGVGQPLRHRVEHVPLALRHALLVEEVHVRPSPRRGARSTPSPGRRARTPPPVAPGRAGPTCPSEAREASRGRWSATTWATAALTSTSPPSATPRRRAARLTVVPR